MFLNVYNREDRNIWVYIVTNKPKGLGDTKNKMYMYKTLSTKCIISHRNKRSKLNHGEFRTL